MTPARRARLVRCLLRLHTMVSNGDPESYRIFRVVVENMSDEDLMVTWSTIELIVDEAMGTDAA